MAQGPKPTESTIAVNLVVILLQNLQVRSREEAPTGSVGSERRRDWRKRRSGFSLEPRHARRARNTRVERERQSGSVEGERRESLLHARPWKASFRWRDASKTPPRRVHSGRRLARSETSLTRQRV